jgi:hypothetical protein
MKLTRVKIDNFRSIKSMDFAFPESGFRAKGKGAGSVLSP